MLHVFAHLDVLVHPEIAAAELPGILDSLLVATGGSVRSFSVNVPTVRYRLVKVEQHTIDASAIVIEVVRRAEELATQMKPLRNKPGCDICIGAAIYTDGDRPIFHLPHSALTSIVEIGADLDVDVYFLAKDSE